MQVQNDRLATTLPMSRVVHHTISRVLKCRPTALQAYWREVCDSEHDLVAKVAHLHSSHLHAKFWGNVWNQNLWGLPSRSVRIISLSSEKKDILCVRKLIPAHFGTLLCWCVHSHIIEAARSPTAVKIPPVCLCPLYNYDYMCVCVWCRPGCGTDVYLPRSLLEKEEAAPPTSGPAAPPVWAPTR